MRKLFEFVIFLFYKYYDKGSTKSISYFSALTATVGLLFLITIDILLALGIDFAYYSPIIRGYGRFVEFLSCSFLFLPFYIPLAIFIKKEDIKSKSYSPRSIKLGNIFLIISIVAAFAIFTILAYNMKK